MEETDSCVRTASPDVKRTKLDTSVQTDISDLVETRSETPEVHKNRVKCNPLDYQVIPVISYDSTVEQEDTFSLKSILSAGGTLTLIEVLKKYKGALILPNIYSEPFPSILTLDERQNTAGTLTNALLVRNNSFLVEPQIPIDLDCACLDCDQSEGTPETDSSRDRTPEPRLRTKPTPSKKTKAQRDQERLQEDARKKVRFITEDMEPDTNFRITLSIKNEANGQTVFYKADKKRFRREKTIKLMVNSFYRVDISFKPTQTLSRALIGGQEVKATQRVHDSTASAYSLYLPTLTMTPSRKGHRDELVLIIQLKNGLLLQLSLQIKLYKQGDSQHCDWGSTFHCVEFECEVFTEAGIVSVIKETFR